MRSTASAVKQFALAHGLALEQPHRLPADAAARLMAVRADAMVVAAYGQILPPAVLQAARYGAWNIHASLLPRWRGAAPIQRALLAGDSETGISIMQMDAGLDTGPVLAQQRILITREDDAASLHDKLAVLGGEMMTAALVDIEAGRAHPRPQSPEGATYARKVDKREAMIDWRRPAGEIERAVRAFNPSPGASTLLDGETVKLWRARLAPGSGIPGEILQAGPELIVACGEGALVLGELQRSGGKRVDAAAFLRGRAVSPGARFQ